MNGWFSTKYEFTKGLLWYKLQIIFPKWKKECITIHSSSILVENEYKEANQYLSSKVFSLARKHRSWTLYHSKKVLSERKLQELLNSVAKQSKKKVLTINSKKVKIMVVSQRKKKPKMRSPNYRHQHQTIREV